MTTAITVEEIFTFVVIGFGGATSVALIIMGYCAIKSAIRVASSSS